MDRTNATPTDRQRKTLASQLDRLDAILDTLGGLNEAVASAVEQAVGLAVKGAITEVLTNEEVLGYLRESAPGREERKPRPGLPDGLWGRIQEAARKARETASHALQAARERVSRIAASCRRLVAAGVEKARGLLAPVVLSLALLARALPRLLAVAGVAALACALGGHHLPWLTSRLASLWGRLAALLPPWEVSWAPAF